MNELILVVDDEAKITQLARDYLERNGFGVITAADGATALAAARRDRPDLIVLDLNLPGMDGLDVCRTLRRESSVPIIMLTARVEEMDRLIGLELGADDYITKPFSPRDAARVRAVLRRVQGDTQAVNVLRVGVLTIDEGGRQVQLGSEPVDLTRIEFNLLTILVRHAGQALSRGQTIDRLHGVSHAGYDRSIDAHIKNLRRKIEADPARSPLYRDDLWRGLQVCRRGGLMPGRRHGPPPLLARAVRLAWRRIAALAHPWSRPAEAALLARPARHAPLALHHPHLWRHGRHGLPDYELFWRRRQRYLLVWIGGCGLLFAIPVLMLGLGIRAYRRYATPLADVMAAADAVADGDLSERVPERGTGEFARLSRSFNRMTEELAHTDQLRRNLTADVAHELRNPLHIIQGNLEGILDDVYAPTDAHIAATLEETRALTRLVEDLQTISAAEAGQLTLVTGPVDLAEVAARPGHVVGTAGGGARN